MDSHVSFFRSHLTYVPFCTDSEIRFLQPSFFGACYWGRWKQEGWSIRLARLWSCSEFSEYQASTLAGGSRPVVFLPSSHRQGSDLVLSEQEAHSWASGHSQALPAGEWLARQVTGMRQGWGQARMPGLSDWLQICRDMARNGCSSSKSLSSLVPGQTTWVRAALSIDGSGRGTVLRASS